MVRKYRIDSDLPSDHSSHNPHGIHDDDPAEVELEYVHQTPKAVLFYGTNGKHWIPKSCILTIRGRDYDGEFEFTKNESYKMEIKTSIAYEAGLI